jgi:hypothetical protein
MSAGKITSYEFHSAMVKAVEGFLATVPDLDCRERGFSVNEFICTTAFQPYILGYASTGNHPHDRRGYLRNYARHPAALRAKAYGTATSNQCSLIAFEPLVASGVLKNQ